MQIGFKLITELTYIIYLSHNQIPSQEVAQNYSSYLLMLHFDGQFLSIKKAMFAVKRGEYLRKYNIFEVNFDSGVCISMGCIHKKEYMTSHPSLILQTSIFVQKSLKMGQNGPLYREICIMLSRVKRAGEMFHSSCTMHSKSVLSS